MLFFSHFLGGRGAVTVRRNNNAVKTDYTKYILLICSTGSIMPRGAPKVLYFECLKHKEQQTLLKMKYWGVTAYGGNGRMA